MSADAARRNACTSAPPRPFGRLKLEGDGQRLRGVGLDRLVNPGDEVRPSSIALSAQERRHLGQAASMSVASKASTLVDQRRRPS